MDLDSGPRVTDSTTVVPSSRTLGREPPRLGGANMIVCPLCPLRARILHFPQCDAVFLHHYDYSSDDKRSVSELKQLREITRNS